MLKPARPPLLLVRSADGTTCMEVGSLGMRDKTNFPVQQRTLGVLFNNRPVGMKIVTEKKKLFADALNGDTVYRKLLSLP